jgi:transposase
MRRSFNGLFGLVRDHLGEDPLSGHVFLFSNGARTGVKALVWDGSGLWVCAKRLERGCFHWPAEETEAAAAGNGKIGKSVVMRPEELSMLLNGLDLKTAKRRRNWYRNPSAA